MQFYYLFILLILAITTFSYINHKFFKWPASIAVMGLSLFSSAILLVIKSFFPLLNEFATAVIAYIDFYSLVMKVVLGFLLFAGAFQVNVQMFTRQSKPILWLATLSTILSTFLVGGMLYFVFYFLGVDVPLIYCLLFGSLISPTDPIAVLGILRKVGIPVSIELKVVGESLLNDGIAIVLFTTIYNIALTNNHDHLFSEAVLLFLKEAGGGIAFGAIAGFAGFYAIRSINNYKVEILITLVIVTVGYTLADLLEVSAPLAMVVAGLITGSKSKDHALSHQGKKYVTLFWELTDDFLNMMLFLLMGFQMLVIPVNWMVIIIGLITVLIVLVSRFLSVLAPMAILPKQFEKGSLPVLTWGAMRGGVSIALALSLPKEMFSYAFLAITYLVVIFSIIVQGLTMKKLIKRLGLATAPNTKEVEAVT